VLIGRGQRVDVEIVADVGPEYLASRARALSADVVLCVDDRIPLPDLAGRTVLGFHRRVDPGALIEAALRVIAARDGRVAPEQSSHETRALTHSG
jgi:hypothetical protein